MTSPVPLNALRAFDAVMRLGSATRAAEELGVTHGAVSRQIAVLSDRFGLQLFTGPRNARRPTADAERLWREVGPAFFALSQATDARTLLRRRVRVSCLSTLAGRWLIPRLAAWPHGGEVELTESYAELDRSLEGADVAIRMRGPETPPPPGLTAINLAPNRSGPVVAPGVDLRRVRRLLSRSHPQAIDAWSAAASETVGDASAPPTMFDHQQTTIEACLAGLGVCVTQELLVRSDLLSGRLIAPFGFREDGATFAAFLRDEPPRAEVRRLLGWLAGAFGA